jgi:hypothetical protein
MHTLHCYCYERERERETETERERERERERQSEREREREIEREKEREPFLTRSLLWLTRRPAHAQCHNAQHQLVFAQGFSSPVVAVSTENMAQTYFGSDKKKLGSRTQYKVLNFQKLSD